MENWLQIWLASLVAPLLSSIVWFFIMRSTSSAAYRRGHEQAGQDFSSGLAIGYAQAVRDFRIPLSPSAVALRIEEICKH